MTSEPRGQADYSPRQTDAARRVLVDVGQVLASFADCLVVVGGWTPDLLLPNAEEPHVGSIDVDLALDAAKLNDGRYAVLVKLLLNTKRYRPGEKDFQLVVEVDLKDGEKPVQVEVEFLAPKQVKLKKHRRQRTLTTCAIAWSTFPAAWRNPRRTGKNAARRRTSPRRWRFCAKSLSAWMRSGLSNWWSFTPRPMPKAKPCRPGVLTSSCRNSSVCFDRERLWRK